MSLYRINSGPPVPLPGRVFLNDGTTRTHLDVRSVEELATFGVVPAPAQPSFNPATHACRWVGDEWVVIARPPPSSVTMAQARRALHRAGVLATVQAAIEASGDPEIEIAWEYGQSVERGSPMVVALSAALDLTTAEVDDLFRAAAAIV